MGAYQSGCAPRRAAPRFVSCGLVLCALSVCGARPALGFIISGEKWGAPAFGTGATVTWSLMPTGASSGDAGFITAFEDFMPGGFKTEVEEAFAAWSEVANITFVEVPDTGPSGADIRVGGHFLDGRFGTLAHAFFPNPGSTAAGDVHFDTADPWQVLDGASGFDLTQDIFQVMTHEIGHSIGLAHSVGVPSLMNSRNTGHRGLLPDDIAGAQFIYGAAAGFVAPPTANTTLTLTSASELTVSFSAFDETVVLTDTGALAGSLDVFIGHDGTGPTQLGLRDGNMTVGDMDFELTDPLLTVDGVFENVETMAISATDMLVGPDGSFDTGDTVLGFVDGLFEFTVVSPPLGVNATGDFTFFSESLSLPVLPDVAFGDLLTTPTGTPGVFDVLLDMPIDLSTVVDVAFLAPGLPEGLVEMTIDITGTIEATGTLTVVPEPTTAALAAFGFVCLAVAAIRRRAQRSGR